ncbi:hypothetical protein [Streptomyces bottropensis]|uniref:hypothetical protein n=1 Tax=Streptomyces bottropensis TaxID=42235 RepID=UPI00367EE82E
MAGAQFSCSKGPITRSRSRIRPLITHHPNASIQVRAVVAGWGGSRLVPVHRIVALTGDRQRRSDGQVPAHEPYEE